MIAGTGPRLRSWLLLAAIAIGVIMRLTLRSSSTLWEDEVIAATHAVQPFLQVVFNTAMNDIHPPLYFLQLHIWSQACTKDWWFIANSILYSLIALVSLFIVERKNGGTVSGLTAAAILAMLPAAVWMGEEVRMYAWLSVLLIWMLHFVTNTFAGQGRRKIDCVMIPVLAFALIYSHAIGFIAVLFYGLYAASFLVTRRAQRREWILWTLLFGIAGLMIVPMMASDLLHPADMPPAAGISGMIEWIASTITGNGAAQDTGLRIAGGLTYVILVICGTANAKTRRMTLYFLVGPLLLCIVASLALRPLFKTNFFCTFLSPFAAIVTARLLLSLPARKGTAPTAIVLAGLMALAIVNRSDLNRGADYYRQAAATIKAQAQPGDVVWVPQTDIYWGMAWYLIGPRWGSPLEINAPLRPGSHWWKLLGFLGPGLVARLHVIPSAQSVAMADGIPLVIGPGQAQAKTAKRVWLVVYPRSDMPEDMPGRTFGGLRLSQTLGYLPLAVRLYQ